MTAPEPGHVSFRLLAACGLVAAGTVFTVQAFIDAQAASWLAADRGLEDRGPERVYVDPRLDPRLPSAADDWRPVDLSWAELDAAVSAPVSNHGGGFLPDWLSPCVIPGADALMGRSKPSATADWQGPGRPTAAPASAGS